MTFKVRPTESKGSYDDNIGHRVCCVPSCARNTAQAPEMRWVPQYVQVLRLPGGLHAVRVPVFLQLPGLRVPYSGLHPLQLQIRQKSQAWSLVGEP